MHMVQLTLKKYRIFVAIQYSNASSFLYAGLQHQQGTNDFHFLVTLRSFIEYTRRGIWFLARASEDKLQAAKKLTFNRSGSPGLAAMDALIREALGDKTRPLVAPIKEINNETFLDCLHALTHGNPISVRMIAFGLDKIFQTDMLLVRAELGLNLFRILLFRRMLGEELDAIWKGLGSIYNHPEVMRANVMATAALVKNAGLTHPYLGIESGRLNHPGK